MDPLGFRALRTNLCNGTGKLLSTYTAPLIVDGSVLKHFFSWHRFDLSVAPQNIVPDEDLQPHIVLRAKNGIVVNISPRSNT